jgi:enolase
MNIKKVIAKQVLDSRKNPTIEVVIVTSEGTFKTSSPAGKSTGKYEVKSYVKSLNNDLKFINSLDPDSLDIEKFKDLENIEKLVSGKIGGNSLFVLEASLLKALAREDKKELWQYLGGKKNNTIKIRPVGNSIGGGLHSKGINGKKPDFQEFLFIGNGETFEESVKINERAYKIAGKLLRSNKRNDEGAWETGKTNEEVLDIMEDVREILRIKFREKVSIGIDVASSSFYKNGEYFYKNKKQVLDKSKQIEYIENLINQTDILYTEDPLDEIDFSGFAKLKSRTEELIVGDDLTTTNPSRLEKAIKNKSINGIIVKPNQIGSLLKVKKVIELAKKNKIKTIISHRSGETMDDTIADLAVGWGCDFIKTGVYGKEREAKLKRLINIEK